ncbi:MAG TPA: hypothetical protein DIV86_00235 [Alphaproteobacteria bacterium]|nr:hypothetical protein [Alphaproteobacteria bacterium]
MRSYAKINLFLHILGKRADNYHELQSIFYFPEIYDELEVIRSDKFELYVAGEFADKIPQIPKENIIYKTLLELKRLYPEKITDISVFLTKNLPVAAGIGGGSANAATTLNVLNELFALELSKEKLAEIGLKIGADVPSCVYSKPMIVTGVGEGIELLDGHTENLLSPLSSSLTLKWERGLLGNNFFPKLNILLINPLKSVSTKQIFEMGFKNYSEEIKIEKNKLFKQEYIFELLHRTKNDLQENAIKLCPEIAEILESLNATNPIIARMSGSGATCFAIYETKEKLENAALQINENLPKYWVKTA